MYIFIHSLVYSINIFVYFIIYLSFVTPPPPPPYLISSFLSSFLSFLLSFCLYLLPSFFLSFPFFLSFFISLIYSPSNDLTFKFFCFVVSSIFFLTFFIYLFASRYLFLQRFVLVCLHVYEQIHGRSGQPRSNKNNRYEITYSVTD